MDTKSRDSLLEKKFKISPKHIEEVANKINNDDFSDFDVAHGYIINRTKPLEKNVTMSFSISESQANKIKSVSRKNNISSSQFIRNTMYKELLMIS